MLREADRCHHLLFHPGQAHPGRNTILGKARDQVLVALLGRMSVPQGRLRVTWNNASTELVLGGLLCSSLAALLWGVAGTGGL